MIFSRFQLNWSASGQANQKIHLSPQVLTVLQEKGKNSHMKTTYSYNMFYIWSVSIVAALGGLLFGYDWVVIGGAKPFYEKYFYLTTSFQIGWAMSSALVGCLLGSVLSGGLSDLYGRKRLLIYRDFYFPFQQSARRWQIHLTFLFYFDC